MKWPGMSSQTEQTELHWNMPRNSRTIFGVALEIARMFAAVVEEKRRCIYRAQQDLKMGESRFYFQHVRMDRLCLEGFDYLDSSCRWVPRFTYEI